MFCSQFIQLPGKLSNLEIGCILAELCFEMSSLILLNFWENFETVKFFCVQRRKIYAKVNQLLQFCVSTEHKANIQLQDADGKTALHKCAEKDSLECATYILSHQPDLKSVKDKRQKLALDCVPSSRRQKWQNILL